jgi:pimeloyl-ACP methyl ester carboxylesterase
MPLPPLPELDGVAHHYEAVNGIKLHYAEAGRGEPLLLQHGWPQHWWMWRDFIAPLAERFRVIVPDLRGHGWSDKPERGYRKGELLDDLLALLDRLEIDRVRWVGHDWGAYIGMLAGLRAPERIERLVAMSIPHPWQDAGRDPRLLLNSTYQLVLGGPLGRLAMQRLNFSRLIFRRARETGLYSDAELDLYESIQREPDTARATVQLYRSFLLHELRPFAGGLSGARLRVPTLWLVGGEDPLARDAESGSWREHADDMTVECIPGAGHFLPEELPETVLKRILAFLP